MVSRQLFLRPGQPDRAVGQVCSTVPPDQAQGRPGSYLDRVRNILPLSSPFQIPLSNIVTPVHRTLIPLSSINDINDSAKNQTIPSFPAFYQTIIATLFDSATAISSAGYSTFLFMLLPPLDRNPANVVNAAKGAPLYPNTTQIHAYNDALTKGAKAFGRKEGVKVLVFDTYGFLNGVLDDGARYGLKNTTEFCAQYNAPDIETNYAAYGCLPLKEYFWYSEYQRLFVDLVEADELCDRLWSYHCKSA